VFNPICFSFPVVIRYWSIVLSCGDMPLVLVLLLSIWASVMLFMDTITASNIVTSIHCTLTPVSRCISRESLAYVKILWRLLH